MDNNAVRLTLLLLGFKDSQHTSYTWMMVKDQIKIRWDADLAQYIWGEWGSLEYKQSAEDIMRLVTDVRRRN